MRHLSSVIRAAVIMLACAVHAQAQSTFATITGAVTDPTGAAVANATVEATNVNTGYVYTAASNDEGIYTLNNLLDGTYGLKAKAEGFGEFVVNDIILAVRENRRVDVGLQVGTVSGTVDVTAGGATLIETETARVADVKDREQLRALPLTLRRAWDYFTLSPQINKTTSGFGISFAGTHNNQGEANIDGITLQPPGGGFGFGPLMDRTENLQEVRVEVSGNTAESGTPAASRSSRARATTISTGRFRTTTRRPSCARATPSRPRARRASRTG